MNLRNFLSPLKIVHHPTELLKWINNDDSNYITVSFDLTLKCNQNCLYCPYRNNKILERFDNWENIKNAIDKLSVEQIKGICFTGGGEPLVNKHASKAIEYAKTKNISSALVTNGTLLTKDLMYTILSCCDWVRISVDAASSKTYNLLHNSSKSTFQELLVKIEEFVKLKNEIKSKTTIGIAFLTSSNNINEMTEFAYIANSIKVDYFQFRPLQNPSDIDIEIHQKVFWENINSIKNKTNYSHLVVNKSKYDRLISGEKVSMNEFCEAPFFSFVVGADGNIYVCAHHRYIKEFITSNILDNDWKNERQSYLTNEFSRKKTNKCPKFCKNDDLNELLFSIKKSSQHVNFI